MDETTKFTSWECHEQQRMVWKKDIPECNAIWLCAFRHLICKFCAGNNLTKSWNILWEGWILTMVSFFGVIGNTVILRIEVIFWAFFPNWDGRWFAGSTFDSARSRSKMWINNEEEHWFHSGIGPGRIQLHLRYNPCPLANQLWSFEMALTSSSLVPLLVQY